MLMHSVYPDRIALGDILRSMSTRNTGSVKNELNACRNQKLVVGDTKADYRMTLAGHSAAAAIIKRVLAAA